ncbi:hypothetical protein BH10CYA1_BH10CYA1_04080 [soil metagenome]
MHLSSDSKSRLTKVFHGLSDQEFDTILQGAEVAEFALGSLILGAGNADALYVLLAGKVRLTDEGTGGTERTLALLGECGDMFGSIGNNGDIGYSARSSSDSQVLRIRSQSLSALLNTNASFKQSVERRLRSIKWHQRLRKSDRLNAISPGSLELLLAQAELVSLTQGQKADADSVNPESLAFILSGCFSVAGGDNLMPGQCLNCIAANTDGSVRPIASVDSELLMISSSRLQELCHRVPTLERELQAYKESIASVGTASGAARRLDMLQNLPVVSGDEVNTTQPSAMPETWRDTFRRIFRVFPILFQQNEMDCGSTCIGMIALYFGQRVDLNRIRSMAGVGTFGTSLYMLAQTAERVGFMCRGVSATYEGIRQLRPPLICHWNNNHFVVLYQANPTHAIVGDPSEGLRKISAEEFSKSFSGSALEMWPTQKFGKDSKQTNPWQRLIPIILPFKSVAASVIFASLLFQTLMLIMPLFTQVIVDKVVVHQSLSLLNTMLIGMIIFSAFETVVTFIRGYLQAYLAIKLDQSLIVQFFRHLLSLPYRFFEDRTIGDIITRFGENQKIRDFLSSSGLTVLLDGLVIVVYFCLIFYYNITFGLAVLAYISIFITLVFIYTPILKQLGRTVFNRYVDSQSFLIEAIRSIQLIKASAAEHRIRWKWEILLGDQLAARFNELVAHNTAQSISKMVHLAGQILLLWMGAQLVVKGDLSVGQLIALNMMVGMIGQPVMRIVEMWDQLQDVNVALERLCDVLDHDPEEDNSVLKYQFNNLAGTVKFENVTFRYSESAGFNTLNNVSFEVQHGQLAALVGRSGCGKSTILKLVQGLYAPTIGKVMIDGADLTQASLSRLREQTGVVAQHEYLFRGSVRENIAFNKPSVSMQEIIEAANIAGVHDVILNLPMGYETMLSEGGFNLSGGQRQRIAIARAVLHKPTILLFDEATSALDSESERRIQESMKYLRENRTMFVVAHRLSTVKEADVIFVVDRGQIVESGTHDSLLAAKGLYYYLCSQQLSL